MAVVLVVEISGRAQHHKGNNHEYACDNNIAHTKITSMRDIDCLEIKHFGIEFSKKG